MYKTLLVVLLSVAEACADENNQLVTVFKDGNMVKEQTLAEIRGVLHNGNF